MDRCQLVRYLSKVAVGGVRLQQHQNGDKTAVSKTAVQSKLPIIAIPTVLNQCAITGCGPASGQPPGPNEAVFMIRHPSGPHSNPRPIMVLWLARHHHVIHFAALLAPAVQVSPPSGLRNSSFATLQVRLYYVVLLSALGTKPFHRHRMISMWTFRDKMLSVCNVAISTVSQRRVGAHSLCRK